MRKAADLFRGRKRRALWGNASKKERTAYKSFVKVKKINARAKRLITKAVYCQDLLRAVLAGKRDAKTVNALEKSARELGGLIKAHEKNPVVNIPALLHKLTGTYWFGEKVAEIFKKEKLSREDNDVIEEANIRVKHDYPLQGIKKEGIERFVARLSRRARH